jgi:hypothetical protein
MNQNTRVKLNDTFVEIVVKLAEGNPGAITVMAQLAKVNEEVDPLSFMGPYGPILALDSHGIYGPHIWILYKEICGESIPRTIAILRAVQLGFLKEQDLLDEIKGIETFKPALKVDVPTMVAKVRERLELPFVGA